MDKKGFEISRFSKNIKSSEDKEKVIKLDEEWSTEYTSEIQHLAYQLDKRSKTTYLRDREDYLEVFVS